MNNILKKVLLCDSGFSALPILESLKSQGFHVGVCGSRVSDPCHAIADQSFLFDYSNKDQLLDVFRKNEFDYIVPGCTDLSYISSSWVANKVGVSGYDSPTTTQIIHDKGMFRAFSTIKKYPIPKASQSFDDAKKLNFPILIKPTNSFSGKGIHKVEELKQLNKIYDVLQKGNSHESYLFEEYIEGKLFSHSAFLKNKKVFFDFFVSEYCTIYPYQVNSSNLSTELPLAVKNMMRSWLETFATDANLSDGLVHTQFISNNSSIWIIESARRCPGDLYSKLIELSTGINYSEKYITSFCDLELVHASDTEIFSPISRHTVSVKEECLYASSSLMLPHLKSSFISLKKIGETLKPAPYDRAGIYFIEHENIELMESYTKNLAKYINVQTLKK